MNFGISFKTAWKIRAFISLAKAGFLALSTILIAILLLQWLATLPHVFEALALMLAILGFFVVLGMIFSFPRDASKAWWVKRG